MKQFYVKLERIYIYYWNRKRRKERRNDIKTNHKRTR